jgi:hypothetical protein
MVLLTSLAAPFLWAHFLGSTVIAAAAPQTQSITAKWSADLRPAVGSAPLGLVLGGGHESHNGPMTSLWFLDNNTIVATFVTREGKPSLSSRDNPDANLPLRLRAVFLDAGTGKITAAQAWPTESRFAAIVATADGKFVTETGTTLTLYSSDAKELRKLSLPPIQEGLYWSWLAHASPTGRSILFLKPALMTTAPTPWIWVDTDSLQIVRSWEETQSGWVGISDDTIGMTACTISLSHCDPNVEVRALATDWKRIASIQQQREVLPKFVNRDTLFLSGVPWRLLRTDGTFVFTESAPSEGDIPLPSAGGQRFVVPFFKLTGAFPSLDIGGHGVLKTISVYDAPFHERSYKLTVSGPKFNSLSAHLALSPDGSLLAILQNESVYVFQLPPLK